MTSVRVGLADIGPGHPCYIIAEIGANHDNDIEQAKLLIRVAADAGADCAKFQLYRSHELYPGQTTPYALPEEWLPILKRECHDHGVEFLCSVFSLRTLAAYLVVEPAAIKIASPEATNLDLIDAAAETGLPVIVSTGACTPFQMDDVAATLDPGKGILLHCVSAYPAPPDEMNLAVLRLMSFTYSRPSGLSDHTLGRLVAELAVAAGACVLEKHLTLDHHLSGPDHSFAMGPREFKGMVRAIRRVERIMGDGVKRPMPSEDPCDRRQVAA